MWRLMTVLLFTTLRAEEPTDSVLYVRQIVIVGNETTKEHVILREMSLKVGHRLTMASLEHDQKRIYSLQLFTRVDLDYETDGDQATLYVRVAERWYIFPIPILGFKYRDTKKFFYGLGFIHENFRGRNEKLVASFALGFDRWVSLAYQNPKLTDGDDIFFRGYVTYSSVQNQNVAQGLYQQKVFAGSVTVGKRFGLYQTALGIAGYEDWRISDPRAGRTVSLSGRDRFLMVGWRYTLDTRDLREYPTSGHYLSISASKFGFGESEVNLYRAGYDLRGFTLVTGDIVLGVRTFGNLVRGGVSPNYLHSYFGYDERIRGHFKSVLEGESLVGGNAEVRFPILSPRYVEVSTKFLPPEFSVWRYGLSVGVFADGGKTWYRTQSFGTAPWYSGAGAGVHFLLPYSLILRTEYAVNNLGKGEFVLDFGSSF